MFGSWVMLKIPALSSWCLGQADSSVHRVAHEYCHTQNCFEGITVSRLNVLGVFSVFMLSMLMAVSANAAPADQKKDAVQINLEQFRIVVKEGKELKESLTNGTPIKMGDTIEYRATYKNVSTAPVRKLVANLDVPKGTEYVAKSVNPVAAEATVDKINFAPIPLIGADKKEIPVKDYRALHWRVSELAPGQSFVVSARMKVSTQ